MNWLLDVGADADDCHIDQMAVWYTSTTITVGRLRCTAHPARWWSSCLHVEREPLRKYVPVSKNASCQHGLGNLSQVDAFHSGRAQSQAVALLRHGANMHIIYEPSATLPFTSYWKTVVESGDMAWATELLAKYGANWDWPSRRDMN